MIRENTASHSTSPYAWLGAAWASSFWLEDAYIQFHRNTEDINFEHRRVTQRCAKNEGLYTKSGRQKKFVKRDRKWTENLQETENLEMGKMEVVASGGLVRLTPGKGAGPPLSESSLLSFEHHPPLTTLDIFSFSTQESEEKAGLWKCCGTERDNIGDIPVVGASGQFELGGNGSSGQLAAAAQKCRPPYCEAARAARSRCRGRDKVQHRHCATPHRGQHCATHRGHHCATPHRCRQHLRIRGQPLSHSGPRPE